MISQSVLVTHIDSYGCFISSLFQLKGQCDNRLPDGVRIFSNGLTELQAGNDEL